MVLCKSQYTDKLLATLVKKKKKRHKLPLLDMKENITIDSLEMKRIIKEYCEQLSHVLENLVEMDRSLC